MIELFPDLPVGYLVMLGALLIPVVPRRLVGPYMLALPVLGLVQLWSLPLGHTVDLSLAGLEIQPTRVDRLSRIFGTIFHMAALLGALYALHVKDRLQHVAALVYAGSAIAAAFAGDLISLFINWELTAISSVFLIWARRTERAYTVGLRYLVIQVLSGVLLLAGAISWYAETGSLAFERMELSGIGSWLIFLSFGIKAAFPFLHNWLQDAYPEATVTGTVFLSAFTTKLAIYALCRGFAGTELLIPIGATMTAFPIFFAVIENDMRRVLAYSLNNQLGYMVVGIGIGTEMSINGTAAHAFAHIIYKALLFMSMGAVLHRVGTIKAAELGGLYKSMPLTTVFCMIGALAISAFPFLSGFVSKSMIMTAAADEHYTITFVVLLFASAGVCDHSGIKIPFFTFFAHDSGKRCKEAPINMLLAMGTAAALCVLIGIFPDYLYALLPHDVAYNAYTVTHVVTQLQLLMFAGLAFGVMMRAGIYPPELNAVNIDFDWTYRRAIPALWSQLRTGLVVADQTFRRDYLARTASLLVSGSRETYSPKGRMGEPWATGPSSLIAAVLLGAFLLLYYF
ncbi:MAG: Na(+)/H(+) antiporter subunit D [Myxococcales bacterium]|nr:Na(+)/H(+) antiporter subunit D [Myxococcales bacterium]